jgi:glycopeptide antibiotics resistance protein
MIEFVINDLFENISLNALQSIIKGAFLFGGYLIIKYIYFHLRSQKSHISFRKIVSKYLFVCYIMFVLYLVLFSREPGSRETVNLKFFGTYSESPRAQAYMFENILLLIPFGFLLPFLSKRLRTFTHALTLGALLSIIIEITQLITKRGYFQVDDIWLNTIGSGLGFVTAFILIEISKVIRTSKSNKRINTDKASLH